MDSLNKCEVSFASPQCSYACRKMSASNIGAEWGHMSNTRATRMPLKQIRLDADVVRLAEAHKLHLLETSQFIGLLVQRVLTGVDPLDTLNVPSRQAPGPTQRGEGSFNKEDKERVRALSLEGMPVPPVKGKPIDPALELHCALIRDFWRTKKGSKGERAWKLLQTGLKAIQTAYGDSVVKEQLELAINGRWASVTLANYERFRPTKQSFDAPQANHPAHKVFKADDLGPEWDIPSATGGRGVLEPGAF